MLPVSESARRALQDAEAEARSLHHSYVGTEHVLLGILREDEGRATGVLGPLGVSHAKVRSAIVGMMGVGIEAPQGELPLTAAAQNAVERAGREASVLGADEVGSEHILLALLRDPAGAASRIIRQLDVDPASIRPAIS
ncbi:MAG: ATP-dependent Clp protease ATP-binding subunit [Solirubrobacterales bacterium]|nr:ATP-dependent Clp protease ATP-binding subunit [Solirubrobacterales bacterium]